MALTKNFLKSRAACKVKFRLDADEADSAEAVYLVGDFNDWNTVVSPMKKMKGGGFSLEIELPSGRDYQFRYLTDAGRWLNDAAADAYVPCSFAGTENSLVKV